VPASSARYSRGLPRESVDLIYLDPPFFSNPALRGHLGRPEVRSFENDTTSAEVGSLLQKHLGLSNSSVAPPGVTLKCAVSWNLRLEPSVPVPITVNVNVVTKFFRFAFSPNHCVK
jgi:hypothetical protein